MNKTMHGIAIAALAIALMLALAMCENSSSPSTSKPTVISSVAVSIRAPANNGIPDTEAHPSGIGYTSSTVSWSPPDSPFIGGETYTASVTLTASRGYTFNGLSSAFVNGQPAIVSTNSGSAVALIYTFPQTPLRTVISMEITSQPTKLIYTHGDLLNLAGLTVKLTYDNDTTEDVPAVGFGAKSITANPANGVTLDNALHDGKPVTITCGDLITLFTDNLTVSPRPVPNAQIHVTAPVKGATPATTATGTGDFTVSAVSWSPNHNPFLGETAYAVTVTLTASSGHTFNNQFSATINGESTTVSNNSGGSSVTLTHSFAPTLAKTVTGMAITAQPTNLIYTHGETLSLAGLTVRLTYDDSSTEDVQGTSLGDKNITANPSHTDQLNRTEHNGKPVTITFGSQTRQTNNLTVNAKNISSLTVAPIPEIMYTGSEIRPGVTVSDGTAVLALNTDYTVGYTSNTNAGTATVTITGMNNYTGSTTRTFTITPKTTDLTVDAIQPVTYTGSAHTPAVTVRDGTAILTLNTDYTVAYTGNTNAGTATVTVTGRGNYAAGSTGSTSFIINKAPGAAVGAPTLNGTTSDSITINAVNATGQIVEYGISTQNSAATVTEWQTGLTFTPPSAGTYYIFARATENANYSAGPPSAGLEVELPIYVDTAADWIAARNLISGGGNNKAYTIIVRADVQVYIGPNDANTNTFGTASGITVTLRGSGNEKVVSPGGGSFGPILTVDNGVTLVLGNSITLNEVPSPSSGNSISRNDNPLVRVNSGGTLIMNTGAKVISRSNDSSKRLCGGVYVGDGGSFTMNDGGISGSIASYGFTTKTGSGVYVDNGGSFTMGGGIISDNIATNNDGRGGGVYVGGSFTMSGGIISGNKAGEIRGDGGGVYVAESGRFTMSGEAAISDNRASVPNRDGGSTSVSTGTGGGVYVVGVFTMTGGTISGNATGNALDYNAEGGGVFVHWDGNFAMSGGTITGNGAFSYNSASSYSPRYSNGGGVHVRGNFTMSGGTITGNGASSFARNYDARAQGGGVYVGGSFTMSGGTITGNSADYGGFTGSLSPSCYALGGGVYVAEGASFTMSNNAAISGNTAESARASGGGVYVYSSQSSSGMFTMLGGTVNGNTSVTAMSEFGRSSSYAGGVYNGGNFTMNGGVISSNTADLGGGVSASYGNDFTINGGSIRNNTASEYGGGVYASGGSSTMTNGEISGNTASSSGGGVYIIGGNNYGASFTMSGGVISGNTSDSGGGVSLDNNSYATFTMSAGKISGNTASSSGGGVYMRSAPYSPTFTMNGGEISGNTADLGGGVYASSGLRMGDGKISGNTANLGGGMYVGGSSMYIATMTGGEISGNTANSGGGVYAYGSFCIVTGTVYGSNAGALSNTLTAGTSLSEGAALNCRPGGNSLIYGTFSGEPFSGDTWNREGFLPAPVNDTIRVVNGVLQP